MTADMKSRAEGPRSKRQMILDAATQEFGGVGFENTKWATVADQVGIGQTALYHYFESKAHCLLTIMTIQLTEAQQRSQKSIDGIDDPLEALKAAVGSAYRVTPTEALQARILLNHMDILLSPRSSEREEAERVRARELVHEIEQEWSDMLRWGMDVGAWPHRDERVLMRLVLGSVNSVWRWYRPNGTRSLEDISDLVVDACVRLVH